jgi:hypothetical protein
MFNLALPTKPNDLRMIIVRPINHKCALSRRALTSPGPTIVDSDTLASPVPDVDNIPDQK